jgi:hypothetical protein
MTRAVAFLLAVLLAACAPAVRPLSGTPTPSLLPPAVLPSRPMQLQFTWDYSDDTFNANGDGAVRVLPPERARLDFFLKNGSAGGFAILEGDSLIIPGPEMTRRLLPPPPLLWAALGRLAVAPTRDTIARIDGDTLRVDMGSLRGGDARRADGTAWRLTFAGTRLARVERIERGRMVEWISRTRGTAGETIRYNHETARRRLTIVIADTTWVEGFDEAIWRR